MMNKNRTIEEVFSQVRQAEPKPLHSMQQIEIMLGRSEQPHIFSSSTIRRKLTMGITSFIVLAGIVSGIFWWERESTPYQTNVIPQKTSNSTSLPKTENNLYPLYPNQSSLRNSTPTSVLPESTDLLPRAIGSRLRGNNNERRATNQDFFNPNDSLSINSTMPFEYSFIDSANLNKSNTQDSIQGIQKIQLTQEEFKRIGILFDGHKIFIKTEDKHKDQFIVSSISIDSNDYYDEGVDFNDYSLLNITPIIVVSHWNQGITKYKSFLRFPDKSPILESLSISKKELESEALKFNNLSDPSFERPIPNSTDGYPKLSKLIPIYIRLGNEIIKGTNKKYGADVYLWYYPTPEFVSALPDRYRIPLQQELDAITDVVECQMPVGQVCERLTGEKTFFDFCRKSSGAIATVQAYPNPASQQITCHYQLTNQRLVTITLHDLSGKFLRELMAEQSVTAGTHETQLQLGDITPGAYLIAVKTDTGDQAVQRIIVQQ